jgi:hypothetical protein
VLREFLVRLLNLFMSGSRFVFIGVSYSGMIGTFGYAGGGAD